jgi:hypothetical protein
MDFILESELLWWEIEAWESYKINIQRIRNLKI